MNNLADIRNLLSPSIEDVSIYSLLINLFVGLTLSILIKKFYKFYGNSTSNRGEFAKIFPLITLTNFPCESFVCKCRPLITFFFEYDMTWKGNLLFILFSLISS